MATNNNRRRKPLENFDDKFEHQQLKKRFFYDSSKKDTEHEVIRKDAKQAQFQPREIEKEVFELLKSSEPEAVERGLIKLCAFMSDAKEGETRTHEAYGFASPITIGTAMRSFQWHEGVQEQGCRCLEILSASDSNSKYVLTSFVMEAVVNAIQSFPESRSLLHCGLKTIINLSKDATKDEVVCDYCSSFVNKWNGIQLTLSAMERFSNDVHMLQSCCSVLWNVALVEKFHEPLYDAGALEALCRVFQNHHSSNDDLKRIASGGIDALLETLQSSEPDPVERGLIKLCAILTDANESETRTHEAYGFASPITIGTAMRSFQWHEGVQEQGCRCLEILSASDSNSKYVLTSFVMEAVVNAIQSFPESRSLLHCGLKTIINLSKDATKDEVVCDYCSSFVNKWNGIQLTLSAMERFSNDVHMLQSCCSVLWNVALVKKFHEPLYDAGALEALCRVFEKHYSSNDDLKRIARDGMNALFDDSS